MRSTVVPLLNSRNEAGTQWRPFFLQDEVSMRFVVSLLAGAMLLFFPAALYTAQTPASADVEILKPLEAAMMAAAAGKGAAGSMSFYAEDAVELPDLSPPRHRKDEIGQAMQFLKRQEQPPRLVACCCDRLEIR
jgi:hypothetical protein